MSPEIPFVFFHWKKAVFLLSFLYLGRTKRQRQNVYNRSENFSALQLGRKEPILGGSCYLHSWRQWCTCWKITCVMLVMLWKRRPEVRRCTLAPVFHGFPGEISAYGNLFYRQFLRAHLQTRTPGRYTETFFVIKQVHVFDGSFFSSENFLLSFQSGRGGYYPV